MKESGSEEKAAEHALTLRQDQLLLDALKLDGRRDLYIRTLAKIPDDRQELRDSIADHLHQYVDGPDDDEESDNAEQPTIAPGNRSKFVCLY
jgi:hypothetical protein